MSLLLRVQRIVLPLVFITNRYDIAHRWLVIEVHRTDPVNRIGEARKGRLTELMLALRLLMLCVRIALLHYLLKCHLRAFVFRAFHMSDVLRIILALNQTWFRWKQIDFIVCHFNLGPSSNMTTTHLGLWHVSGCSCRVEFVRQILRIRIN